MREGQKRKEKQQQQRTEIINVKMTQNIRYLAHNVCHFISSHLAMRFYPFGFGMWMCACESVLLHWQRPGNFAPSSSITSFLFSRLCVPQCCANTFHVNFGCFRFASKSEVKSRKRRELFDSERVETTTTMTTMMTKKHARNAPR